MRKLAEVEVFIQYLYDLLNTDSGNWNDEKKVYWRDKLDEARKIDTDIFDRTNCVHDEISINTHESFDPDSSIDGDK